MTEFTHESILIPLIVFCRVGACFMVLPGISSPRVPVQLRLFIAVAVALALTPFVHEELRPAAAAPASDLLAMLVTETLAGLAVKSRSKAPSTHGESWYTGVSFIPAHLYT